MGSARWRRAAAEVAERATLGARISAFTVQLREVHGLRVGQEHARDALRAFEIVGLAEPERVRGAFRAIFCASYEDIEPFERAFKAFFRLPEGVGQPGRTGRRTRADGPSPPRGGEERAESAADAPPDDGSAPGSPRERRPLAEEPADQSWFALQERYSAAAAQAPPPEISSEGVERMLRPARRLVSRIRRGRSLRWAPQRGGSRFDARRTLRASVRTAGDPVVLHRLGHPLRNPRFVILIDGSGSMAKDAPAMLEFARALNRTTRRCATYVFSTGLREVTREFRTPGRLTLRDAELREAWGGGTRIGACLAAFVKGDGARILGLETYVLIFSDGLDVDEIGTLRRALRAIRRRVAGIVWLNPHANVPGYSPSASGMQAALPFVDVFAGAANVEEFGALADRF